MYEIHFAFDFVASGAFHYQQENPIWHFICCHFHKSPWPLYLSWHFLLYREGSQKELKLPFTDIGQEAQTMQVNSVELYFTLAISEALWGDHELITTCTSSTKINKTFLQETRDTFKWHFISSHSCLLFPWHILLAPSVWKYYICYWDFCQFCYLVCPWSHYPLVSWHIIIISIATDFNIRNCDDDFRWKINNKRQQT
jgi:hypothetical protein